MIDPPAILAKVRRQKIDQAEVYLAATKHLKVEVRDQKVEAIEEVAELGCGLRIIKDKKLGFAFTADLDEYVLNQTIAQAVGNARNCAADEFQSLPGSAVVSSTVVPELFDKNIGATSIQEKIDLAKQVEKAAYACDKRVKKTERVTYSDQETEVWLVNTNGLNVTYKTNHCGAMADIIAGGDGGMEAGFGFSYVKKFADLNADQVGREAAERATQALGAKLIPSQKIPLVFDPFTGSEILGVLATMLSAEAVQKGKSMFAGKLGRIVGTKGLNVIDNGRLPGGLASAPFDAEGVPTRETSLIAAGQLNTFLHNTYTANKERTASTGNAVRSSYQSLPSVGTTNLYIAAGPAAPAKIIGSVQKGLYITRVLGMHTANPISGQFSVGAFGLMIEHGKITFPVRGITIAGNIMAMFKELEAVGSDLRFFGDVGSPTLLLHGLTVSGG